MWVPLKEKKKAIKRHGETDREGMGEESFILNFSLFASFSDSQKSDRQNSSGK